jgi:hypothetical protein
MSGGPSVILIILAAIVAIPLAIAAMVYLIVPVGKAIFWLFKQVFVFIGSTLADTLRLVGALITGLVLVPITIGNVLIGRWSASGHYGRAIETELKNVGGCVYRLVIGNPARLLCLTRLTEGLEQRIPAAVAAAPGPDRPAKRHGQFPGYAIVGSLPGGGSGSKLYVATPSPEKLAAFVRNGQTGVDKVVIKSFSIAEGSTLSGVLRENRALPAAKRLGLILEHEEAPDRFHYVMRYVPGESLGMLTQRLHAGTPGAGLGNGELKDVVDYAADLLRTLCVYHAGGLWHKDVKPDNIIVSEGQAHLVDFGLVTPLRSSMTLTTHGTEYFRDPEMVRMALRGVKVHEVDGAKFDIYAAGAVLYSMIENSFPAHGGLSQISKRCPEALRWIVRRAMTDYDKRYESAGIMLQDLEVVAAAGDPFVLRPADLPSMRGAAAVVGAGFDAEVPQAGAYPVPPPLPRGEPAGSPIGGRMAGAFAAAGASSASSTPKLRVQSWWTGKYVLEPEASPAPAAQAVHAVYAGSPVPPPIPVQRPPAGATAAEQLARARARAHSARARAQARLSSRRRQDPTSVNAGVVTAFFLFLAACVVLAGGLLGWRALRSVPGVELSTAADGSSNISVGGGTVIVNSGPVMPQAPAALPEKVDWSVGSTSVAAVAPGSEGTLLVVRDAASFVGEHGAEVKAQLLGLTRAGYELRGDGDGADAEGAGLDADSELVAQVRARVGITPVDDTAAGDAVRGFLEEHPDIDALVWFGRGDGGNPFTAVFGRRGLEEGRAGKIAQTASDARTLREAQR